LGDIGVIYNRYGILRSHHRTRRPGQTPLAGLGENDDEQQTTHGDGASSGRHGGRRLGGADARRVKSITRKYRATDAQRAQLEKIAAKHIRDLEDLDKTNSVKGRQLQRKIDPLQSKLLVLKKQAADLQGQLRKLQDELLKLEASRKALLKKQAAELDAVITEQQRVVHLANELTRRHTHGLWDDIDDGKRQRVTSVAQDAARTIIRADAKTRRDVERAAVKELTASLVKIIGPTMTEALHEDAVSRAASAYRRIDLTDKQKEQIYALTEKFSDEQVRRHAKIADLEQQLKTLRAELSRTASTALKQTIIEKVLTGEQREQLKPKNAKAQPLK